MSGITIAADSGTQFDATAAEWCSVCRLDDNHFAVAYRDNGDFNKGKVNVGSTSGTAVSISESNLVVFNNDSTDNIEVRALSASLIVIAYRDVNSNTVYIKAGSVSGTTITLGSAVLVLNTGGIDGVSIAILDSSNFVVSVSYGVAVCYVGSVSGTTITLGSVQTIASGSNVSSVGLDGVTFVSSYGAPTLRATAGTVNVGAKTVAFGTEKVLIATSATWYSKIRAFDSQHFVVSSNVNFDNTIRVIAASVNLSTLVITAGSSISSVSGTTSSSDCCAITPNNFIISYYTTTGTEGEVVSGTLSGSNTIAWDAQGAVIFDNNTVAYNTLCRLTDNYFLLGYKKG